MRLRASSRTRSASGCAWVTTVPKVAARDGGAINRKTKRGRNRDIRKSILTHRLRIGCGYRPSLARAENLADERFRLVSPTHGGHGGLGGYLFFFWALRSSFWS